MVREPLLVYYHENGSHAVYTTPLRRGGRAKQHGLAARGWSDHWQIQEQCRTLFGGVSARVGSTTQPGPALPDRAAPTRIRVSTPHLPDCQYASSRMAVSCVRLLPALTVPAHGPLAVTDLIWVRSRSQPTRPGTCRVRVTAPAAGPWPKGASAT